MLVLCSVTSAQVEVVYPYNPDVEPDGYIGVNDLLALLPIFGQEFEVATVDSDTSSAIVLVDESTQWLDCKKQCKALGRSWDIISVDASAVHFDTLSALTVHDQQGYPAGWLFSIWWVNEIIEYEERTIMGKVVDSFDETGSVSDIETLQYLNGTASYTKKEYSCWCEAKVLPEIEYQILVESSTPTLQGMVQEAIDEGWLPLGGIGGTGFPIQAMWRYAE
jgi:hypothetical protein